MPRLQTIDPAAATGKAKEIFDGPLSGKHFNIFKGMANSPHVLNMYLQMNQALAGISLSMKEVEAVQLAASNVAGCEYCQAAHTAIGKSQGLTDAEAIGARKGRVEGDARLGALASLTRSLVDTRGHVSDDQLKAFKDAGFDDQAVVEVIGLVSLANLTNTFNNVHRSAVDFPAVEKV
ncbi:MAG: carboxymuconolactone decarboxylase family protein [Phycisphaerales bacterium]